MPSRSSKQPLVVTKAEQVKDGVFWSTVMMLVVVQRRRNYNCVSVAPRMTGSWIALDVPFYLKKESLLPTTDEYKSIGFYVKGLKLKLSHNNGHLGVSKIARSKNLYGHSIEDAQNAIATDDLTTPRGAFRRDRE